MSESFAAPGAQKKQLLILGTVVGVVALAVALFVMMLGGGSGTPGSILAANAAAKSSATAASGPGAYVIPSEYAGNIGHDPFKPVVVEKSGGVGGSGAATHGAAPSSSATASPSPTKTPVVTLTPTPSPTVVIPTVTPTATVTVTPSPTGLPTSSTSQTLTLVSVDTAANTADVTILANGQTTPYTVQNGKVFGTYFKLVSILTDSTTTPPGHGADFQYGDQFLQLNVGQSAQLG